MSEAKTTAKAGPRFHPAAALAVAVGFGSAAVLVIAGSPGEARDWMVVAATGLMLLLVTLVVAHVVFLASKRSSLAFNVVVTIVFVSFAVFNGWTTMKRREARAVAQASSSSQGAGGSGEATKPRLTREQNKAAVERVAGPLSREIAAKATAFSAVKKEFDESGSIVPGTFANVEDVTERAALLGRLRTANEEFRVVLTGAAEKAREQLTERGMRPAVVDAAVQAFGERMQLARYTEVTEARVGLLDAMARYFDLVSKNWGTHRVENHVFIFESEEANAAMKAAMRDIIAASAKEGAVLEEHSSDEPADDEPASDGPGTDE